MRHLALAGMLLLALILPAAADGPPDVARIAEQILAPTVRIDSADGGQCSGTIVYSQRDQASGDVTTYILTARHCIKGSERRAFTISMPVYDKATRRVGARTYEATLKGQSYTADVALLVLRDRDTWFEGVVKLAPEDVMLYQGEDTWAAGYALGLEIAMTRGFFGGVQTVAFPDANVDSDYYRGSTLGAFGNSGGPLFHRNADGDYEQIGISSATVPAFFFVNMFVTLPDIYRFLAYAAPEVVGKPALPLGGPR